jgi:hypothetical protein
MTEVKTVRMQAGGKWVKNIDMWEENGRVFFKFKFNAPLKDELKAMESPNWDKARKVWSVKSCPRNWFQIHFLLGEDDPYTWYDRPLIEYQSSRTPYKHQLHMTRHGLTYHYVIWSAEMGTGKTLAAIELIEASGKKDWLWVGPKSALAAADLEFRKWKAKVVPTFITYDRLKNLIENWPVGQKSPSGVIFDESSRCKTPTAQRSIAAQHLADSIRQDHGKEGYVVLMSGSPAPKSPADWWMQCEIAQPGFLKEGTYQKFKQRLGLIVEKESLITGGPYPHLITWLDDENKCKHCGMPRDHANHDLNQAMFMESTSDFHNFEKSVNEVSNLYNRMQGLTLVYFKKDCLDLPEKQFRTIELRPTNDILNAAKLITASAPSTIMALTLLRELSDGFQYHDEKIGFETCPRCQGACVRPEPVFTGQGMETSFEAQEIWESEEIDPQEKERRLVEMGIGYEMIESECQQCEGCGQVPLMARKTTQVPCPKENRLIEDLDNHDEDGRLVVYAGFTGSIDRITGICRRAGWHVIRVDGRGWLSTFSARRPTDMLEAFQDKSRKIEKICFVAHPGSGGMGVTLTESYEIIYYSNTFNAEDRIQSMDRIHRPGMDINRGALITDYVHLPTDLKVINNLDAKKKLQDLSLGQFHEALLAASSTTGRVF